MSRFPTTEAFLGVIEDTVRRKGAKRVTKLWLRLGRGVTLPVNSSAYLETLLKGTAARNAEIYIRRGYYAGRCRRCSLVFDNERNITCPDCGGICDSIVLEKKFIIERMELEL